MTSPWNLTAKLLATGITFLVLALASISLTLWVTWKLEGGAAAVNEAGRLRMQTYRLALSLSTRNDSAETATLVRNFDRSMALLDAGDPSRPLFVPAAAREHFARVQADWSGLHQVWLSAAPADAPLRLQAEGFVTRVDAFVSAIEDEMARWTAVLHGFQLAMMALAIGSAVAMLYAGYLLVLNPLSRLKRGLAAVQQGDLAARVEVETRDEFGELSAGFNEMAQTLQSLYGSLEHKVEEKTRRLEVKRQRLADLYEVSGFLAQASDLQSLAQGFAAQVRRIARADASAVRWCDEGNQRYLLLASDNLPAEVAADEACLETGACHCGQARAQAATRVIPIHAAQPAPQDHCSRAGYATVLSVPVKLQERVLGEFNLFFRQATELDEESRGLLDALASHLANAIESLRAEALEREAAVAEERGLLARELHDSIAQALAFMKIQVQLLRQSIQRGDAEGMNRVVDELDTGVRECYADVRELLVHFRTRTSEEDIEPALRATLQKFEHQTGLATLLQMQGHGVALAPDVQVQALHIIQEALSNVRKHAQATRVVLTVTPRPAWRFEVHDDGVGFEPGEHGGDGTHVGLRIMQERAGRIGATVEVTSSPGRGCTVVLTLAQPQAQAAAPAAEHALAA